MKHTLTLKDEEISVEVRVVCDSAGGGHMVRMTLSGLTKNPNVQL